MAARHPLGFRGFAGRRLRYAAAYRGCWLALIGWQSGAFKCRPRDLWIGWHQREQFLRLHLIANNTRMLLLCPAGTIPNHMSRRLILPEAGAFRIRPLKGPFSRVGLVLSFFVFLVFHVAPYLLLLLRNT